MMSEYYSWEPAPHSADLAMKISANSQFALFSAALDGFLGLQDLNSRIIPGEELIAHRFNFSAHDFESLLIDFLTECIYAIEVHNHIPAKVENITLFENDEWSLSGELICRPVRNSEKPEIGHIKAVTYHDLVVVEIGGKFEATIVFDT